MAQLSPIINQPVLYMTGLLLSNDATTPLKKLDVAAGICRDSNNVIDMNLGNYLNLGNTNITANSVTVINFLVNGINGLDTGTFAASSMYYIFVIGDSSNKNATGTIASLSATAPVLPLGYDSIRCIGCALSDGSTNLLPYYVSGGANRYFQWDAPIAVTVTASGTSTTYSAMDLTTGVPAARFGRVSLKFRWTPAAASNTLNFTPTGAVGDFETIIGQVAAVAIQDCFVILPLLSASKPQVSYKCSAGTVNNIWVQGFDMLL